MEIRPARVDEYAAIGELVVDAYATLKGGHLSDDYAAHIRDVATRAESAVVLVAMDGGRLVGTATYVPGPGPYAEFHDEGDAGLRRLAVDSAARGKGVGQALVEDCIEQALAADRTRLVLHTT